MRRHPPPRPYTRDRRTPIPRTELIDKCIGSKMWVLMKGDKELVGTLRGAPAARHSTPPHATARREYADATSLSCPFRRQASTTMSTWCSRTSPNSAPPARHARQPAHGPAALTTQRHPRPPRPPRRSEITSEGKRITKLDQILLNGNNVALLVPGGDPNYTTGSS